MCSDVFLLQGEFYLKVCLFEQTELIVALKTHPYCQYETKFLECPMS